MRKTLFLLVLVFALSLPIIAKAEFSDVPSDHPYAEAINYSKENNIVSGYSDGTFKPENKIYRAEFTKIIIETVFTQDEINSCIDNNIQPNWKYIFFPDISRNDWFAKYVCIAKVKGIISGYSDGTFQPNKNISFVEATKIINKAFNFKTEQADDIWYKHYVSELSGKQSIPQTIENLDKEITRSEFVEIIWRLKTKKYNLFSMVYYDKDDLKFYLGAGYAKDKNYVYFSGNIINNADPETFELVSDGYFKDKSYVYYYGQILDGADPETFELLSENYAKDRNYVYFVSGSYINILEAYDSKISESLGVSDADPETFEFLGGIYGEGKCYAKDKNYAYFIYGPAIYILENADPETFEFLGERYTKDKNYVYSDGEILENVDPATFDPNNP